MSQAARWTRRAAWLIPLALLLASFGRLILQPSSLLVDADRPTVDRARVVDATPGNDLTRQFWPLHLYVAQTIARTGHFPEWDDRGFGGRPLVGNPQAGLFYPPVWFCWLVPAPATLGWITLGHLIWAILGMRRLAQTLGLGAAGVMVSAGSFTLSPYVLAQTFEGHYPHVWAAAWYPCAFAATTRLGRGDYWAGWTLSVALAAVVLVGHPQEGYYLAFALGIWAAVDLLRLVLVRNWRRVIPAIFCWGGVGCLVLGLVAVELLPDLMAQGDGLKSSRLPLRLASRYHPLAINAVQLINPLALGGPADYFGPENYWETLVGVGLIPLVLAGVGATWTADRGRVRGWILLVVAAVMFAAGRKLGLLTVLYELVPGMDRFRVPSRSLFLATLGMAVLAGFGVEALVQAGMEGRGRFDRWARLALCWGLAVILLGGVIGWGVWRARINQLNPTSFGVVGSVIDLRAASRSMTDPDRLALAFDRVVREPTWWLAVVGLSFGLGLAVIRPAWRRRLAVGLGLLGLIELAWSGQRLLVVSPVAAFASPQPIDRLLKLAVRDLPDQPPPRIRADEATVPDWRALDLGLTKTDINDTFQIQRAADLYERLFALSRLRLAPTGRPMDEAVLDRIERTQQAILDRMSVSLVVLDAKSPRLAALVARTRWPIAGDGSKLAQVAVNPGAIPRAYVVPRASIVTVDDALIVDQFASVDPKVAVFMDHDPLAHVPEASPRQAFQPAQWVSKDPDRVVLQVTTEAPGLLVVADTWMPGWTGEVDGRAVRLDLGNHAQRVVALPDAGRHEVVLSYQAPGFRRGLAISLGSIVILVSLGLVGRFQGRRKSPI